MNTSNFSTIGKVQLPYIERTKLTSKLVTNQNLSDDALQIVYKACSRYIFLLELGSTSLHDFAHKMSQSYDNKVTNDIVKTLYEISDSECTDKVA
ncbi:hypothetical protein A1QO_03995 [Vibrio genomosp. F10 str. ZF-129]|uniref:Uncharacterized protein n=1 Tax=Vibrio genomosp. F10 str. ZF-129 TaxID=1187848 RepID=A0A1E5BIQ0_9VIBR|nr:hypothetical protein [Vibrio genomosp. F10]OEE37273.1 hypothetical protein A1QO_03995 [Vibrio genomosp. F10 str. ZF-129]